MIASRLSRSQEASARKEWVQAVEGLVADVRSWASEHSDWAFHMATTDIAEEQLEPYRVPVVEIETSGGRVVVQPVARAVLGAEGRIDMYAWPTLNRVRLLRRASDHVWVVRTDSGLDWPQPWGKEVFTALVNGLLGTA